MKKIYLTKMVLNPRSNQVRSEIGKPQELHRTISRAFPAVENTPGTPKHEQKTPRNEYNILHRLDIERHRGKAFLLVQAEHEPDWSFLGPDYADELETKEISEKYRAIKNGMRLFFRLQANPSKRAANKGKSQNDDDQDGFDAKFRGSKRRRIAIHKEDEQIEWLARQGERYGFKLSNLKVNQTVYNVISQKEGKLEFNKPSANGVGSTHRVTYGSAVFEGVLVVTDSDQFQNALFNGIGQGKAYGFGLLSIAPVKEINYAP